MKHALVLLALSLLIAAPLLAGEKPLDLSETATLDAPGISFTGTLDDSSPTWDRIYASGVDLTCSLQANDSGNDGEYYAEFCFRVTDTDTVTFVVDPGLTNISDTVVAIYCDPFDAATPAANLVSYDDDGGDGYLSAFVPADGIVLVPGNDYHLVLSTYQPGDTGEFVISASANVVACQQVANEALDWGQLKAQYR